MRRIDRTLDCLDNDWIRSWSGLVWIGVIDGLMIGVRCWRLNGLMIGCIRSIVDPFPVPLIVDQIINWINLIQMLMLIDWSIDPDWSDQSLDWCGCWLFCDPDPDGRDQLTVGSVDQIDPDPVSVLCCSDVDVDVDVGWCWSDTLHIQSS